MKGESKLKDQFRNQNEFFSLKPGCYRFVVLFLSDLQILVTILCHETPKVKSPFGAVNMSLLSALKVFRDVAVILLSE